MDKPDVDFIEGLSPAISIDQKSASRNPRSTVGTVTEVYDYLRLLYARIGKPHCPNCGRPVARQSPQQIVDRILAMDEGTRFMVLAPVVRGRKGEYGALLDDLAKQGFARARVDGVTVELADRDQLDLARYEQHTIEVVVDRLVRRDDIRRRLTESLETALSLAEGVAEVVVVDADGTEEEAITFSQHLACTHCGLSFEDPVAPQLLLQLALRGLPGLHRPRHPVRGRSRAGGARSHQVPGRGGPGPVVRRPQRVLHPGGGGRGRAGRVLARRPRGRSCSKADQKLVLYGAGAKQVHLKYRNRYGRQRSFHTALRGHRPLAGAPPHRGRLRVPAGQPRGLPARGALPGVRRAPGCGPSRWPSPWAATTSSSCARCPSARRSTWWPPSISPTGTTSSPTGSSARSASGCSSCLDVGLDYLTLARSAATLSGGEAQRIRLASQIGSGLVGVLYVLDEPSIGLHQRDNQRLIGTLKRLRDLGNTVIVVEHDEETIRVADHVVDVGPGAGEHGGRIVHSGPVTGPGGLESNPDSLTGQYISGAKSIPVPAAPPARGAASC